MPVLSELVNAIRRDMKAALLLLDGVAGRVATLEFLTAAESVSECADGPEATTPAVEASPVSDATQKTRAGVRVTAPPKPLEETPGPVAPDVAVSADFDRVFRWASERGTRFRSWDDLPVVNAKRERLGLARFKRAFPVRGRFG